MSPLVDASLACVPQGVCSQQFGYPEAVLQTNFPECVAHLLDSWRDAQLHADESPVPVFMDLLSGPCGLLACAFDWAGWKVVQPLDRANNF